MKLLLKIPTRSRPQRVYEVVRKFQGMRSHRVDLQVLISVDDDDITMTAGERARLEAAGCTVVGGTSKCKIEAVNRDLQGRDFDILVVAADDMLPLRHGWDEIITRKMQEHWPNLDGALWFNDGFTKDALCTMPVMGSRLYEKFGYVYHRDYTSLWCDNEYSDVLKHLGRLPYIPDPVIIHRHPCHPGGFARDAQLSHTESFFEVDRQVYERRRATVTEQATPLLSICIASLAIRNSDLRNLLAELNRQISRVAPAQVEIRTAVDDGRMSVGAKRNLLLKRAVGWYVAFVDDDDMVDPGYVSRILEALQVTTWPDGTEARPDVVGINGIITTAGRDQKPFSHSVKHGRYYEEGGVYYRTPNHLNPVRTSIARQVGFPEINHGEDTDYAGRLMASGLLLKEKMVDPPLYHYRFDPRKSKTHRRR